jgi:hypothetical protein
MGKMSYVAERVETYPSAGAETVGVRHNGGGVVVGG